MPAVRLLCDTLFLMLSVTQKIKQKAFEIGFHKIGIARAEGLETESAHLREWLDKDFQGEMQWLGREPEKRADPRMIFAAAESVIVVALNYYTPHKHPEDEDRGKISRYAWGDDYHDVLKEKLGELLVFIKTLDESAEGKICVDTAPVMDKAWAARAGLGWIGKHSNLITKEYGSWVFLGEILLNLTLEYDAEIVPDHCGTCRLCLDACPTNAIIAPYLVDSRRCLSYATIELRSTELPDELSKDLNGWFYGCDICQDVCPWNRFEKPTTETRFEPREQETAIDLEKVLNFSPDEYAARFRRSAIKRAKLPGLRRNARALQKNSEKKKGL